MKKAVVISQKYSVGHIAGIIAWNKILNEIGYSSFFWGSDNYKKILDDENVKFISSLDLLSDGDLLIIFNISTKDGKLINKVKRDNRSVKVVFIYHEPWRGIIDEIKRFGIADYSGLIKQIGRFLFARNVVKNSDLIICPSSVALFFYAKREKRINSNVAYFPLIFSDDRENVGIGRQKVYFSYIASASLDKGVDRFFEFVKYASKINDDIKFQIVTSSDVSKYINQEINDLVSSGRMKISHRQHQTEKMMNIAYEESVCTWLLYRSSTQSGVLPKAFMWGAPCIATDVGVFPEVINRNNGFIVGTDYSFSEVLEKYELIKNNICYYSQGARATFEDIYFYKNKVANLKCLLDEMSNYRK